MQLESTAVKTVTQGRSDFPRLRSHSAVKISKVRNVPHTHPVFNPVSPTTLRLNASIARGDTKKGMFFKIWNYLPTPVYMQKISIGYQVDYG